MTCACVCATNDSSGTLVNLRVLRLMNNNLMSLPREIGRLTNLQSLWHDDFSLSLSASLSILCFLIILRNDLKYSGYCIC
jgi:Leucine-rich repeat (LRR) protein